MATEKQRKAARRNVKIKGRSKMGKDELRRAIDRAR
jgi:hypothetical protein